MDEISDLLDLLAKPDRVTTVIGEELRKIQAEFGKDKKYTFTWYYLVKIFPNLDPKKTTLVLRYIVPILVLVLAVYLQVFVGYSPVLNLIK